VTTNAGRTPTEHMEFLVRPARHGRFLVAGGMGPTSRACAALHAKAGGPPLPGAVVFWKHGHGARAPRTKNKKKKKNAFTTTFLLVTDSYPPPLSSNSYSFSLSTPAISTIPHRQAR